MGTSALPTTQCRSSGGGEFNTQSHLTAKLVLVFMIALAFDLSIVPYRCKEVLGKSGVSPHRQLSLPQ